MIKRFLQTEIEKSLKKFPIVGIIGSRQVGKTTLAKEIKKKFLGAVYLDLELPSDYNKILKAEFYLSSLENKLVIIDEVQRFPELFPLLRALVDRKRKPSRFIILGSSSPDLIKKSSETLAGRIIYHELPALLINEIKNSTNKTMNLWLKGGYPESYLANSLENSFKWRESFIRSFLERDLPQLGIKIPSIQLRRFWMMLAHYHGNIWNASKIASSFGVSSPTIKSYLDILEDTFVIRQLLPFYSNVKKRIIKSPKIYIRDSGLLHSLLNIESFDDLMSNPIAGHSWEGFVIEQIINNLNFKFGKYFYRTSSGSEIDLIITRGEKPAFGIEIKLSLSPQVSQQLINAASELKLNSVFIVYPGKESYQFDKKIFVISIDEIQEKILKKIDSR